jgi:hypothetical protein
MLRLSITGPKKLTITSIPEANFVMVNPFPDKDSHAVLAFYIPGIVSIDTRYIVDMSRLQFGAAGRGAHGENYYIGLISDYMESSHCKFSRHSWRLGLEAAKDGA